MRRETATGILQITCGLVYATLIALLFDERLNAPLLSHVHRVRYALGWSVAASVDAAGTASGTVAAVWMSQGIPYNATASPEVQLSLLWMSRTRHVPLRDWFNVEDTVGHSGDRLSATAVQEGQVIFPGHALYLYGLSFILSWLQSGTLIGADGVPLPIYDSAQKNAEDASSLLQLTAFVLAAVVVGVGVPVVYRLAERLAGWVVHAVHDRRNVPLPGEDVSHRPDIMAAAAADPKAVAVAAAAAATHPTSASASSSASKGAAAPVATSSPSARESEDDAVAEANARKARREGLKGRLAFAGSMTLLVCCLMPAFVLEATTLHPVCICTVLVLWAADALFMEEDMVYTGGKEDKEGFDLSTPVGRQGLVVFFAQKPTHSSRAHLVMATGVVTVAALTSAVFLFPATLYALWAATACFQRAYRRVFVRVEVPLGQHDPAAGPDGFIDVGPSCYWDRQYLFENVSRVFGVMTFMALAMSVPFWYGKQSMITFMDSFLPSSPVLAKELADASDVQSHFPSLSGSKELSVDCLNTLPTYYSCSRPNANLWLVTEYYGVPWTKLFMAAAGMVSTSTRTRFEDAAVWIEYVAIVGIVVANGVSLLVLALYRLRRPTLRFETPLEFVVEHTRQQEKLNEYWKAQALRRHAHGVGAPPPPPPPTNEAAGQKAKERATPATCISHEEYALKQATLFSWMLLILDASCVLLIPRTGLLSFVPCLVPLGLIASLHVIISQVRKAEPEPFTHTAARLVEVAKLKEEEEAALRAAAEAMAAEEAALDEVAKGETRQRSSPSPSSAHTAAATAEAFTEERVASDTAAPPQKHTEETDHAPRCNETEAEPTAACDSDPTHEEAKVEEVKGKGEEEEGKGEAVSAAVPTAVEEKNVPKEAEADAKAAPTKSPKVESPSSSATEGKPKAKGAPAGHRPGPLVHGLNPSPSTRWCSMTNLSDVTDATWIAAIQLALTLCGDILVANHAPPCVLVGLAVLEGALTVTMFGQALRCACWSRLDPTSLFFGVLLQALSVYMLYHSGVASVAGVHASAAVSEAGWKASDALHHEASGVFPPEATAAAAAGGGAALTVGDSLRAWASRLTSLILIHGDEPGGEGTIARLMYESAVVCVLLVGAIGQGIGRIGRLLIEMEEVRFVPVEQELAFFNRKDETASGGGGRGAPQQHSQKAPPSQGPQPAQRGGAKKQKRR